jgi:starch phosphorylase
VYPLEASGTSGMKAGINGVLNLSVLDGWWAEGYKPGKENENGWAIKPTSSAYDHGVDESRRDYEEARTLYELLQDKVAPLYYDRGPMGYSPGWVGMSKRSIASITQEFNSARMVGEYVSKYYQPAAKQWHRYSETGFTAARQLAEWKTRVRTAWPRVSLRRIDDTQRRIDFGSGVRFGVAVRLDGLVPSDVTVELLFSRPNTNSQSRPPRPYRMEYQGPEQDGESLFTLELTPEVCGKIEYRLRVYPHHEMLTHPFEMGMMVWL